MSINYATCTFTSLFLASSITSDLFLTFDRFHVEMFSSFHHSLSTASFAAGIFIARGIGINVCRLCSSGSSLAHQTGFRGAARGAHLSTRIEIFELRSTGPSASRRHFQCPRSRTATLELPWSSRSLAVH